MKHAAKFCLAVMLFGAEALAEQRFVVPNGGTVVAAISKKEMTRIAFEEEVTSIHAIQGEMEVDVQGSDLFVRPRVSKPIHFFVKTASNQTYQLSTLAENIPATQLWIQSDKNTDIHLMAPQDQALSPRVERIIQATLHPRKHLGYSIRPEQQSLPSPHPDLTMQRVGWVTGNHLVAEKIMITNRGLRSQKVAWRGFVSQEAPFVYLTKTTLAPEETSVLIRIKEQ